MNEVLRKLSHMWMNITAYLFYMIKTRMTYCIIPAGNQADYLHLECQLYRSLIWCHE